MATPKKICAAFYLRVSTTDKGQETDNQLLQLREFCDRASWDIFDTYIDRESGRKGKRQRSDFSRMFDDASLRKFDIVLFWASKSGRKLLAKVYLKFSRASLK